MKRLVDEREKNARDAELVDALHEKKDDPFMAARVRARIDGEARPRRRTLRPIGVLAALLLLCLVTAASAMVGRAIWHRVQLARQKTTSVARSSAAMSATAVEPTPVITSTPEAAPEPPPTRREPERERARERRSPPFIATAPASSTASAAETQLLLEAYVALRQRHDASAALDKIDDYLTLYPRGALTEEAYALAFDATATSHDRSKSYAEKYLAQFPHGKHSGRAMELVEGSE